MTFCELPVRRARAARVVNDDPARRAAYERLVSSIHEHVATRPEVRFVAARGRCS